MTEPLPTVEEVRELIALLREVRDRLPAPRPKQAITRERDAQLEAETLEKLKRKGAVGR